MSVRNMNSAPSGNNGDKYGISDVNRREYRDMVMRKYHENSAKSNSKITEPKIENAITENKVNVAEENNIEANSPKVENAAGNMKSEKVDYIDWPDWRIVVGYGEKEDRQAEAEDEIADVNNAEISKLKGEPIVEDVKPVVEDARLSAKELAAIWAESLEAQRLTRENYTEDVKPIVEDAKPITEDMKPAMVDHVMAKQDENKVEVAEDGNIDVVSPKVESVTEDVNSENQNTMQPDKAREEYYARKHEERAAQLAQFRMNEYKEKTGEQVDKNESDRKLELRHQFDQIKLETDTFLKMQAGLGLMNEKEIRDYKDNLNKQEKNALEYMREGGDGSLAPMENLMKRSLDQISVFEANIQATPEYQEMERKKALVKKGLDAIKERRGNDAELGVNDFHFKEKAYKMQANLAEREFLAKAFSAEDKKNTNEALNAATEKFNKLDEEAIKLTRELKAGGRKLTFEDYQKIDAAWGASAAAEAKVNEIKNADKKEIAFDFAKNQYEKVHKGEQMNGVEGSFLSKFNVLTGEDTIEKFEPTVKDKMGGVAAKMTNKEDTPEGNPEGESGDNPNGDPEVDPSGDPKDPEADPSGKPKDPEVDPNGKPKDPEADPNGKPKDSEADPSDSEKDKKKGLVAGVIDKIKKHGHNIKLFLGVAAGAAMIAFLAQSGSKFFANNTAVEQGMDKNNNGNTDGNVAEALEKHDANGETDDSDSEKLSNVEIKVRVGESEVSHEFSNDVDMNFSMFKDSRREGNSLVYAEGAEKLNEMRASGASEEEMGKFKLEMMDKTLAEPHALVMTAIELNVVDCQTWDEVNDLVFSFNDMTPEQRSEFRHKVNVALAEKTEGATLSEGSIEKGSFYDSNFATNLAEEGNFQLILNRDSNGVHAKERKVYWFFEKDGKNIFNENTLGGGKEKMLRLAGKIKRGFSEDLIMKTMEANDFLGNFEKCGGGLGQYIITPKESNNSIEKQVDTIIENKQDDDIDVVPPVPGVIENITPNHDEPAPKPKNETPPSTPKENPKTPENNVSEGKTNTASANDVELKLSKSEKESDFTNREGTDDLNLQTNLPGSEVTDKAQFDAMVKESIEQNSNPNTTWTFQDNSQGIVHQEGVATEKQADAENRSVLPEETRPEQANPEGSVLAADKVSTAEDKDSLMSAANADNATAHESGQTHTVEASVSE